jgi:hypothetical protein
MLKGRDLIMIFDRFVGPKKGSSVAQDARVQVQTPDGRFFDVQGINLVENKIIGARETHRIVISTHEELAKMGPRSPVRAPANCFQVPVSWILYQKDTRCLLLVTLSLLLVAYIYLTFVSLLLAACSL